MRLFFIFILVCCQACQKSSPKWFKVEDFGISYRVVLSKLKNKSDPDIYAFFKVTKNYSPTEKQEMISELLRYRGDKRKSDFIVNHNRNLSKFYLGYRKRTTIEIQALFLINQIYFDNPFYYSPYEMLVDKDKREILGDQNALSSVYSYYSKWYKKVKKLGLNEAKKQNIKPLDESPYQWMYGIDVSPRQALQFKID